MVVCKFFQDGNCRYGQSCRFEHIYGSKYSYRAPQTQTNKVGNDVFNRNQGQGLNNTASILFRSAVQDIPSYENSSRHTFAQSQPARTSVFDRLGPQPNVFVKQNNEAKSIFAQANQNVFGETKPTNIFQTQNQRVQFDSASKNVDAKSIFAQACVASVNRERSIFGQCHQTNTDYMITEPHRTLPVVDNTPGSIFKIANKPVSNVFGTSVVSEQNTITDDEIYSKMEDLSQTDIEAFESLDFKIGFIPELPPPKILCM